MTKWCNNCEERKESWSEHSTYNSEETYKRHNRCWSCDKWSLVYDSDKNLYDWWANGIDGDQKDILKELGVDISSSSNKRYDKSDLWKLWYWARILGSKYVGVSGKVKQMNFFSTEWNNNLLIVIDGEGSYGINLLVYEMPMKATGSPSAGPLERFYISNGYYSSKLGDDHRSDNSVKKRVYELERALKGKNPILYNEPKTLSVSYDDNYSSSSFPSVFKNGEVKRIELPYYSAKENPDNYIKPLDIVKVFERASSRSGRAPYMVHACIYLGNKKICHARYGNRVEIDDWSEFFRLISSSDKMIRYHPVIAFKNPEKIIEHIAKCVEGKSRYFAIKDNFDVLGDKEKQANNCECLGNRCVLGLNFSELATRRVKGYSGSDFDYSSSTSSPRYHLTENERQIGGLISYPSDRISKIKEHVKKGNENRVARDIDREGIEMQNCIEIYPKNYRIDSSTTELANLLSKLSI